MVAVATSRGWMVGLHMAFVLHVVSAMDNGLARTPPMGWSSWNAFGGAQSQDKMVTIAEAMVATG